MSEIKHGVMLALPCDLKVGLSLVTASIVNNACILRVSSRTNR